MSQSSFWSNPYPWYRTMRETDPVHFERGSWSVFRYNDVQRVLSEYAIFSSQYMGSETPLEASLLNTDPPRHRQLRSLVSQAFTPRRIAQLETRISEIVSELLDNVAAQGHMDVIADLAYPLPVIVIAELLGIPTSDRERFKHWSDEVVGAGQSGGGNAQAEMSQYFLNIIEQRRKEPGNDLISGLLDAQIDGQHLSIQELLGFCVLLLVAGNETTTNLLGNAIWCFDEHPETMEQLRAEPDLMPNAVEEVLRYTSPVRAMFRVTLSDATIGEKTIPAGSGVMAWIASANRDDEQFPNADTFDIRRSPNRHLAFGYGIHFCLGAPLARLEAKVALNMMLERLHDIRRDRNAPVELMPSFILNGYRKLPIVFRPA
ncbi:MAG TPA: cytochrome P450 [Ktedonobacteraceae bacterium]|nr:cytochrome P450 [Ktedonobacteraceae bacterium]